MTRQKATNLVATYLYYGKAIMALSNEAIIGIASLVLTSIPLLLSFSRVLWHRNHPYIYGKPNYYPISAYTLSSFIHLFLYVPD
ncbi:hypothetical protein F5X96DRAFT_653930 [Biscogniauxia mediterranea]|nr:hypothetical protein F5X96DRAFT_653930 [Biscogniauxia mediterranea]